MRLADAALARDLFPQDYHCLGDNENRPIRWMALESLQRNEYSTATDVVRTIPIYADRSNCRIIAFFAKISNKIFLPEVQYTDII